MLMLLTTTITITRIITIAILNGCLEVNSIHSLMFDDLFNIRQYAGKQQQYKLVGSCIQLLFPDRNWKSVHVSR